MSDDVFGPVTNTNAIDMASDAVFGPVTVKRPRGRTSTYDLDIADTVIDALTDGMTLRQIEKLPGVPRKSTLFRWMAQQPEFNIAYHNALRWRTYVRSDEIIDIVDDASADWKDETITPGEAPIRVLDKEHIVRTKMRADYRIQVMAKENPKRYGMAPTLLEDVQKPAETTDGAAKTGDSAATDPDHRALVAAQVESWRRAAAGD